MMSLDAATHALMEAARMGGLAPSIHNTQPWRWRVEGDGLELRAERSRQLDITDPAGRMLTVSCGAALHHAMVALAAQGRVADVARLPNPADEDLLARLTLTGSADVMPEAMRDLQTLQIRRTDRRSLSDTPVAEDIVREFTEKTRAYACHLHLLRPDDVIELAAAAAHAQQMESLDESWRQEMAYWVDGTAGPGLGVPGTAIPETAPQTTVPGRDFGHRGTLPAGPGHDRSARYAILYVDEDLPRNWLRGGEALSALWLTATRHGVAVLPLSAAVEVAGTRRALRRILSGVGEPVLVLRLGVPDSDHAGPPHTPRLPADQIIEIAD